MNNVQDSNTTELEVENNLDRHMDSHCFVNGVLSVARSWLVVIVMVKDPSYNATR